MKLEGSKTMKAFYNGRRFAVRLPRAVLFAQNLRDRFLTRRNVWPALDLLMRTASYDFIQQVFRKNVVHRINVNVFSSLSGQTSGTLKIGTDFSGRVRESMPLASQNVQEDLNKTNQHKPLFVDVIARYRRIEMKSINEQHIAAINVGKKSKSETLPDTLSQSEISSMPLVVRGSSDAESIHSSVQSNQKENSERTDKGSMSDTLKYTDTSGKKKLDTIAEHDMNRLADQVISKIDQKIVAHRERLGRS